MSGDVELSGGFSGVSRKFLPKSQICSVSGYREVRKELREGEHHAICTYARSKTTAPWDVANLSRFGVIMNVCPYAALSCGLISSTISKSTFLASLGGGTGGTGAGAGMNPDAQSVFPGPYNLLQLVRKQCAVFSCGQTVHELQPSSAAQAEQHASEQVCTLPFVSGHVKFLSCVLLDNFPLYKHAANVWALHTLCCSVLAK